MKNFIYAVAVILLLLVAFGAPSCNKSQGKVSDIVQASKAFATASIAVDASGDIVEILAQDGAIPADQAKAIYTVNEKVLSNLDRVRDSINAGMWDTKQIDVLLDNALVEIAKAESEIGIKNPQSAARFREWLALARFGVSSASQIVKRLKPPAQPITPNVEADSKKNPRVQSLTASQLTQIISVSTNAAIKLFDVRSATEAQTAWQIAADVSKAAHEKNKARLAKAS